MLCTPSQKRQLARPRVGSQMIGWDSAIYATRAPSRSLPRCVTVTTGRTYVDRSTQLTASYGMLSLTRHHRSTFVSINPIAKCCMMCDVRSQQYWMITGNCATMQDAPGEWVRARIKFALHACVSLVERLRQQAGDLFEITEQFFDYHHRSFGIC